ncbi:MAG: LAGLIDADG family homing endonuclease [Gaiellales bacterium]
MYGGDDREDGLSDTHAALVVDRRWRLLQEMPNRTFQLRVGSAAVRELFRGLGVTSARAHEKRVPAAIFTAPREVQRSFLRGLFGADGCVSRVETGGKASRYVGLGSRSEALVKDVQRLLLAFGVRSRLYKTTESREASFSHTRRRDQRRVRVSSGFRPSDHRLRRRTIRFRRRVLAPRKQAALETLLAETSRYRTKPTTTLVSREADGQEVVYNLTGSTYSYIVDGLLVANCSESCTSTTRPATWRR